MEKTPSAQRKPTAAAYLRAARSSASAASASLRAAACSCGSRASASAQRASAIASRAAQETARRRHNGFGNRRLQALSSRACCVVAIFKLVQRCRLRGQKQKAAKHRSHRPSRRGSSNPCGVIFGRTEHRPHLLRRAHAPRSGGLSLTAPAPRSRPVWWLHCAGRTDGAPRPAASARSNGNSVVGV